MLADIHTLYRSDFYRITDYKCHCDICSVSNPEYNESLCVSFIRKGFFGYQTFRRKDEVHAGRVLISKPGYEHIATHIDGQPDIVTVFEFKADFLREMQEQYKQAAWFLKNNDIHSLLLQSNPELDYFHNLIWKKAEKKNAGNLQIDEMVMDLIEKLMNVLTDSKPVLFVPDSLKQFHLGTVENARAYIFENFSQNISLQQLAKHCLVSPFHFSRIFKAIMNISPHQYLTEVRLNHAKLLLTTTDQSITHIAFACGFNSPEHFATAYRLRFKINPSAYRKQLI
ncbi:MAG TPA: helix-turn-helix transcriptional regulator [Chitinophagaceae bacterium]|jgi:AraC-like DNA-binding protein|nr:helix-turn-helix transcriptional regulator [Chitinophagaceae bacterium]